jgi:hypothetical protein
MARMGKTFPKFFCLIHTLVSNERDHEALVRGLDGFTSACNDGIFSIRP